MAESVWVLRTVTSPTDSVIEFGWFATEAEAEAVAESINKERWRDSLDRHANRYDRTLQDNEELSVLHAHGMALDREPQPVPQAPDYDEWRATDTWSVLFAVEVKRGQGRAHV